MSPHLIVLLVVVGCQAEAVVTYGIGRVNSRRALDRAEHRGWQGALEYCGVREPAEELPLGGALRDGIAGQPLLQEPAGGASPHDALPAPPHLNEWPRPGERRVGYSSPDWRESMAVALAPETLALDMPRPEATRKLGNASDEGLGLNGPHGPGQPKPSPYPGYVTPAQRRRDKHKRRGQFAPGPLAWSPDEAAAAGDPHWKARGDYWHADWRVEWQDDVAAVDEEIAAWSERAYAWLSSDPWDRGARRLEVA